ncbi:HNH endonuclease [Herbiconiux sp. CPCC 203407]|uniref:HNH endonuclease n=1 Tax=Herbiconiux oxytropis TaxID=2970915 RepID=A0AA41XDR3_9MICO|nr:HNH endonuclease signature motif containing protein [Herbiconiux oxytropis]MCS5721249.1 HNH endonuclease [Herbiconiux oxytropis]MCS5726312.1 HNH endonuclease [Herbiconiux oxytropis]
MSFSTGLSEIFDDLVVVLGAELGGLADVDLLAGQAVLESVGRLVDDARVRYAGEVGARSRAELGDEGLSRSQNFTSPVALVSAVTGVSAQESRSRLELGRRLRGAILLGGSAGLPPFPRISEALRHGELAIEAAAIISRHCAALAERGLSAEVIAEAEGLLVEETTTRHLTPDQVAKASIHLRELLDPDGAEPRDDVHQQQRSLTYSRSADGMIRGRFALTPEQGGLWMASIDALSSPRVTGPRFVEAGGSGGAGGSGEAEDAFLARTATADTRTQAQKNVDAVTELIARAAGATDMPRLGGATTTVNVHVTLADLQEGRGVGWIDGIHEPVPASSIQQLRCSSRVAPTVFGDRGEILHHGKTQRLFTPAQNRALAARDGGCVWPDCDRPPPWCESHHADEWQHPDHEPGRTDIDNGVLLCHFHHSHLHRSAWKLTMRNGVPHLVPPAWIDVDQIPVPTTRRRTALHPRQRPAA